MCLRYLLMQGLAFRGNDESENSLNQGNFLELLKVLASCNEEINNIVLKNASDNLKLTSPDIQRDIINAAATETTKAIITDLGDDLSEEMTNLYHYRVELFYSMIDIRFQELNNQFDEVNTNLLLYMACLDPKDSFSAFGMGKLIQLAKFYLCEFSPVALIELESQLKNFVFDMRMDKKFFEISGIGGLFEKMVATRKHIVFPLVYLIVKLSLILPVAIATVERAFSAMNIIKSSLRNRMGDELLNYYLVTYIERDLFASIDNTVIMNRF
ncbi:hypothetical protein P3X46_016773 [Hevea brasiliensis]|uniref:HAT C-terminal dimerisation domain-containing protein n=1 Tax=Hevea brasiliensis TaxID=3981 RepID=A0ABQ9M068_HEVBR|nr:hypothetical protein P3X46_016773 [Hevea brasiliensis]